MAGRRTAFHSNSVVKTLVHSARNLGLNSWLKQLENVSVILKYLLESKYCDSVSFLAFAAIGRKY